MAGANDFNLPYRTQPDGRDRFLNPAADAWSNATNPDPVPAQRASSRTPWDLNNFTLDRVLQQAQAPAWSMVPPTRSKKKPVMTEFPAPTQGEPELVKGTPEPLRRRILRAGDAVQVPGSNVQGAVIGGQGRFGEPDDRAKARTAIDDAMYRLANQGGGLNMASKRRMYTDLVGQKAGMSDVDLREQNNMAMQDKRLAQDTRTINADLAEKAAERRDRMNLAEAGFENDEIVARLKGALTPKDLLDMKKTELELQTADLNNRIKADEYELGRGGVFEKVIGDRVGAQRKAGMPEDRIGMQAALDASNMGLNPNDSPTAAAGYGGVLDRVRGVFNDGDKPLFNVWGIGDDAAPGSFLTAQNVDPGALQDVEAVSASPTNWWRQMLTGAPEYRFELTGPDGRRESRYSGDKQLYDDVTQLQAARRRTRQPQTP